MISKRAIVLLVIIALIALAIAFSAKEVAKDIESVYMTESQDLEAKEKNGYSDYSFSKYSQEIFVIIEATGLETTDKIRIIWHEAGDKSVILQDTTLSPAKDGSGIISVSLVKKDGQYKIGSYILKIYLNSDEADKELGFEIS